MTHNNRMQPHSKGMDDTEESPGSVFDYFGVGCRGRDSYNDLIREKQSELIDAEKCLWYARATNCFLCMPGGKGDILFLEVFLREV